MKAQSPAPKSKKTQITKIFKSAALIVAAWSLSACTGDIIPEDATDATLKTTYHKP